MIFDIHCHILPGIDDGARNADSTKRMLDIASREGIDAIVATPHFLCDIEAEQIRQTKELYKAVREWWKNKEPNKELFLGNELFYSEGVIEALEQGIALTMNGTKYVLVEFPVYAEFAYMQKAIQKLRYAGYIPIIAHVERYQHVKERKKIQELVDMGAYMQVNASTILGRHGYFEKRHVMQLIKHDLVHFIGTDAHGSRERRPEMRECVAYLEKKLGVSKARRILEKNPERMLKGEGLDG